MNLKYIKFAILILFFFSSISVVAQRNIFRAGSVVITSPATVTYGSIADINDGNSNTDVEFRKDASSSVELTMELAQPQVLKEYAVSYYYGTQNATTITLSGSQNKTTWTQIDTRTVSASLTNISATVTNQTSFKYYRLLFANIARSTLDVKELSAFGEGLSDPTLTIVAGATSNAAKLSWTQELRGEGSYELERSTDRINFTQLTVGSQSLLTYDESTLNRNTAYWYRVRAVKDGFNGPWSAVKELVTGNDVLVTKPILNVGTSSTVSSEAFLAWTLTIGGPGSFDIERSLNGIDFTVIKTLDKATLNYTDNSLTHNTSYWYRIRGKNDVSTSPYSDIKQIKTINDAIVNGPVLTGTAPTGTQAVLSWTINASLVDGFEIEKSLNGTDFTSIGKLDKSFLNYTEESLNLNTSYWYRITAFNYLGKSPNSNVVKLETNSIKSTAQDITDDGGVLRVSADNSGGPNAGEGSSKFIDNDLATKWLIFNAQVQQNLSATYEPKGAYVVTSYSLTTANDAPGRDPRNWRFEGSDDNLAWTVLDTRTNQLGATAERLTTFNYAIANPGTKAFKFYRIAFTSNNGSTDIVRYQIGEWQIMGLDPTSPDIPAKLQVTTTTANTLSLTWEQDQTVPTKNFILHRSIDGLLFEPIDTLEASVRTFTDRGLYDGQTYYYRIKAIGEKNTAVSGWSNVATAKTLATDGLPLMPTNLAATVIEDTSISLAWNDRSTDETGFVLERSRDNIFFEEVKILTANTVSYTDTPVWPGNYYFYRVAAVKDRAKTQYSNVVKVLTSGINTAPIATAPLIPQKICVASGEFKLAFNASPGIDAEKGQKLTVTGVKATDADSEKFFSAFSFDPIVTNGFVNYSVTTTGIALPGDSAQVTVTVKDDGGVVGFATDSTEFIVKIYFVPLSVKITSDKGLTNVSRYALVNLTAASSHPDNTTYEWAAAEGIEGARNGIKLMVRPLRETTYTLTATTPQGCSTSASITIAPQDSLVVASVLTPNGDGRNDTWIIWGIEKAASSVVKVTDRQGRLVFTRKNYQNDWDGSFNGNPLPQGGYYYVIEINDGQTTKTRRGVLTIVK